MAFGKFSLFGLVLLLGLTYSIKCNGFGHNSSYFEEEEEGGNDPFIFKKESSWKRVDSEAGQIRVVPVFKKSTSRTASPLQNYELNCIEMDPNSLLVPHYINAHWYIYAYQGKGRIGWLHNQKLIEQDLETGQIYYVPKGSSHYVVNTDKKHRLHFINLVYNKGSINPKRHHESFYLAGGQNPQTLFSGFGEETLAAAFGIDSREVIKVLSKQDRGAIVSLGQEQEGGDTVSMAKDFQWPWSSSSKKHKSSGKEEEKPFDLQKKKPDFSNENGKYIEADQKSFSPLKRQGLGIALTRIEQGPCMTAPYYHSDADAVSVVLEGRGRVEIVLPEFEDARERGRGREGEVERERERERGRGREGEVEREREWGSEREGEVEREREWGSESEREVESYRRVEAELNPGDVFLVPAGYPSVQISKSKEHLEILTFLINNEHNTINFLTGKNSALTEMKDEVLAASLDEKEQALKKVFEAQKDERFLNGPREPQGLSSIV